MQIQKRRRYGQPSNGICSKNGDFVPTMVQFFRNQNFLSNNMSWFALLLSLLLLCTQHESGVDISPINEGIESTKKVGGGQDGTKSQLFLQVASDGSPT